MKKPQVWFCPNCHMIGAQMYEEGEDVWSVQNRIREQHLRYRKDCVASEKIICAELIDTNRVLHPGVEHARR